jgi:hypothetical protein
MINLNKLSTKLCNKKIFSIILILSILYSQQTSAVAQTNGWKRYVNKEFQFELRYPSKELTLVDAEGRLPPVYDYIYPSKKLISRHRVADLGKTKCQYGQSDSWSVCTPEMEGGIEIITLNIPIRKVIKPLNLKYRKTNISTGDAIIYTSSAEGEGIDYLFFELSKNKTLVVNRFYRSNFNPSKELTKRILSTYKFFHQKN